jgi:hypothetical protein
LRFEGVKIGKSATISRGEERMMTLTEKWKMEGKDGLKAKRGFDKTNSAKIWNSPRRFRESY